MSIRLVGDPRDVQKWVDWLATRARVYSSSGGRFVGGGSGKIMWWVRADLPDDPTP